MADPAVKRKPRDTAEAHPERLEEGARQEGGIDELRRKAEKLSADPSSKTAEAIRKLTPSDDLELLYVTLANILKKLEEKKVNINQISNIEQFQVSITTSRIKLNVAEATAIDRLDRLSDQSKDIKEKAIERVKNPNERVAERAIAALKPHKQIKEQAEGLFALNQAAESMFSKLMAVGIDIETIDTPQELEPTIRKAIAAGKKIDLDLAEAAAAKHLRRLINSQGPTATYLRDGWKERVKIAKEKEGRGYWNRYKEAFDEHPVIVGGLTALFAVGIAYLSWRTVKWAFKNDKSEKGEMSFGKQMLLAALTAGGATVLGKVAIDAILAKYGLASAAELKKKAEAGVELTKAEAEKLRKATKEMEEKMKKMEEEQRKKLGILEDKLRRKGKGGEEGGATEPLENGGGDTTKSDFDAVSESVVSSLAYTGPKEFLVYTYCFFDEAENKDEYKRDVDWAIDEMSDEEFSQISALWEKYKNNENKKIPGKNGLIDIDEKIGEERSYKAVQIVVEAMERYKKRRPEVIINEQGLTLREFFEDHLYKDPTFQINKVVQGAMRSAADIQNITDIANLTDIDLKGIGEAIKGLKSNLIFVMAKDFGIKIDGLDIEQTNKQIQNDFSALTAYLYEGANLKMTPENAMEHRPKTRPNGSQYDPRAIEAAKLFFENVQERTDNLIIPKAIERFDLGPDDVLAPRVNSNIIAKHLKIKNLSFKNAIHLHSVSRSIDLGAEVKEGDSPEREFAFLFTVLSIIPDAERAAYMTEFLNFLHDNAEDPDFRKNFPAFAVLVPYFELTGAIALKGAKDKLNTLGRAASTFMADRTPEEHRKFVRKMANKNWRIYGKYVLIESTGGTIRVGLDCFDYIIRSGKASWEEITDIDGIADLLLFVPKIGGIFIFGEDGQGAISLAGEYFVMRPYGNAKDMLSELYSAAKNENFGDAVDAIKIWHLGAAPFITIGAGYGWWDARRSAKGWLPFNKTRGAVKGGLKGLAYPYYGLKFLGEKTLNAIQATVSAKQTASEMIGKPGYHMRHFARRFGDVLEHGVSTTLDKNLGNLVDDGNRFKYHMSRSPQSYFDGKGALHQVREDPAAFLSRAFGPDGFHLKKMNDYGRKVAAGLNSFYGNDPKVRLDLSDAGFDPKAVESAHGRFERFIENVSQSDDALEKIKLKSQGLSETDLRKAVKKHLKKINKLSGEKALKKKEINALLDQIKNPGDVEKLASKLKHGANVFKEAAKPGIVRRVVGGTTAKVISKIRKTPSAQVETPEVKAARILEEKLDEKMNVAKKGLITVNEKLTAVKKEIKKVKKQLKAIEVGEVGAEIEKKAELEKRLEHLKERKIGLKKSKEALKGNLQKWDQEMELTKVQEVSPIKDVDAKIKKTTTKLEAANSEVAKAQKKVDELNDMRKGKPKGWWSRTGLQGSLDKAEAALQTALKKQKGFTDGLRSLKYVQEVETKLATAIQKTPELVDELRTELRTAKSRAAEVLEKAKIKSKFSVVEWGGRAIPVAFAAVSATEALYSAYDYATNDDERKAAISGYRMALYTADTGAGLGAGLTMAGSTSIWATSAGALALPLIPITYMASAGLEVSEEEAMHDYDWAKRDPFSLLNDFYTTIESFGAGDSYKVFFTFDTLADNKANKRATAKKIFRALVAIKKDPTLLEYIHSGDASDKEIERRIAKNYSPYHEYFFRNMDPGSLRSYGAAQRFIAQAQMFHKVMTIRDAKRAAGEPYVVGEFNLHEDRYNITGGIENPKAAGLISPWHIAQAYKAESVKEIRQNAIRWENWERMDTAYLARLCAQLRLFFSEKDKNGQKKNKEEIALAKEKGYDVFLHAEYSALKQYLEIQRGIDFELTIRNPDLRDPSMKLNTLMTHFTSALSGDNKAFLDFQKNDLNVTPSIHALYRLAEYFNYNGPPAEASLKEFFDKSHAGHHGLYWDGSEWMLQERGYETDNRYGPQLTDRTLKLIIERMKEDKNDFLEARGDSLAGGEAYDYTQNAENIIATLEKGLIEGYKRGYQRKLEEKLQHNVAPPSYLEGKLVDHKTEPETLQKQYKEIIEYTKESCGWTQLEYSIIDDNTIELSRNDAKAKVTLHKEGQLWTVGNNYIKGQNLMQAVILGNLKNHFEKVVVEDNSYSAGSGNPFDVEDAYTVDTSQLGVKFRGSDDYYIPSVGAEIDYTVSKGSLVFDRAWNPLGGVLRPDNLTMLNSKNDWLPLFDKLGIDIYEIEQVADRWWHDPKG